MATKTAPQKTAQAISLKGSTKIVTEFFDFSVVRPVVVPRTFTRRVSLRANILPLRLSPETEQHPLSAGHLSLG